MEHQITIPIVIEPAERPARGRKLRGRQNMAKQTEYIQTISIGVRMRFSSQKKQDTR